MFTQLAIFCCHFVCGCDEVIMQVLQRPNNFLKKEKIRSPNDAWKSYLKTWDRKNSQSFQGHCPWTRQGGFTALHMNPQLQVANVLPHVGLLPTVIKLNPSWKTEVSKSAWIKPCQWLRQSNWIFNFANSIMHACTDWAFFTELLH